MSCSGAVDSRITPVSDEVYAEQWSRKSRTQKECTLLQFHPKLLVDTLNIDEGSYTSNVCDGLNALLVATRDEPIMKSGGSETFRADLKKHVDTIVKQANEILKNGAGPIALHPFIDFLAKHADEPRIAEPLKIHYVKKAATCVIL